MIPGASATTVQRRIAITAGPCVMAFALISVGLVDVTVFRGGAATTSSAAVALKGARADLVDREGVVLARDLPVADLYARVATLKDRQKAANDLASATGMSAERLDDAFDGTHNYVLVARQVPVEVQAKVRQLGLKGLEFDPAVKRYYPEGTAAVQV